MKVNSRIRFNPVTKEIEVEGTEAFVKTYFAKIQGMMSGAPAKKVAVKKEPKAVKAPKRKPVKKGRQPKKASKATTGKKRGSLSKSVLTLIQKSPEGIAIAEMKGKTGLKDSQIRNVLSEATKRGKIRTVKRGVYVAV